MKVKFAASVALIVAAGVGAWVAITQVSSSPSPVDEVQDALDEDAAKGVFEGSIGDFIVYSRLGPERPEAKVTCPEGSSRETSTDRRTFEGSELWSDRFGAGAVAILCAGRPQAVNNGIEPVDGAQSIVKAYITELPVPVLFEAPRDRIDQIEINGHVGVMEVPIEAYPFPTASLALIQRTPTDSQPGIVIYVNFASSEDKAIDLAKALLSQ
jgi:hypothetical protein